MKYRPSLLSPGARCQSGKRRGDCFRNGKLDWNWAATFRGHSISHFT